MWVKNIEVTKVENKGLDDRMRLGHWGIVKRVTVEFDVIMLTNHDEFADPLDKVRQNMDSQIWFLRDPVIKAVYQQEPGKAEREPYLPEY